MIYIYYYDDGFIFGEAKMVKEKIECLSKTMNGIGINLNKNKTKIYIGDKKEETWMENYDVRKNFNCEILGSIMGTNKFKNNELEKIKNNLIELWEKLKIIERKQIRYIYFRNCAAHTRIIHILRTIKINKRKKFLNDLDNLLIKQIENLVQNRFKEDQILQIRGPTNLGGLSLRSFYNIARIEYSKTIKMMLELLKNLFKNNEPDMMSILKEEKQKINEYWENRMDMKELIKDKKEISQLSFGKRIWKKIDEKRFNKLLNIVNKLDYVRLISLKKTKFNMWCSVNTQQNLCLTNPEFRYAFLMTLRHQITCKTLLGNDFNNENKIEKTVNCKKCNKQIYNYGQHFISCNKNYDISRKSKIVKNLIYRFMQKVGWSAVLEKNHLDKNSFKRPADIYLLSDQNKNQEKAFDICIPASFNQVLQMNKSSITTGLRAIKICDKKIKKYSELIKNKVINFYPLCIEVFGSMNKNLKKLIAKLATDISTLWNYQYANTISNIRIKIIIGIIKQCFRATYDRIS